MRRALQAVLVALSDHHRDCHPRGCVTCVSPPLLYHAQPSTSTIWSSRQFHAPRIFLTRFRIFVAIPKIAQNNVNDSTLEIESQQVLRPTSGKVDLDIASVTRSDSKYHPELDEFEADLFLESTRPDIKPFGRLTFPAVKVAAENRVQVAQTMEIIDMDQFIEYNKLVVDSEEFSFGVKGRTGLKLGSLPKYTVDYDKTVTMKGTWAFSKYEKRSGG